MPFMMVADAEGIGCNDTSIEVIRINNEFGVMNYTDCKPFTQHKSTFSSRMLFVLTYYSAISFFVNK